MGDCLNSGLPFAQKEFFVFWAMSTAYKKCIGTHYVDHLSNLDNNKVILFVVFTTNNDFHIRYNFVSHI